MPKMTISFLGTGSGRSTNNAHTALVDTVRIPTWPGTYFR